MKRLVFFSDCWLALLAPSSVPRPCPSDRWPALLVPSSVPRPCPIGVSFAPAFHLSTSLNWTLLPFRACSTDGYRPVLPTHSLVSRPRPETTLNPCPPLIPACILPKRADAVLGTPDTAAGATSPPSSATSLSSRNPKRNPNPSCYPPRHKYELVARSCFGDGGSGRGPPTPLSDERHFLQTPSHNFLILTVRRPVPAGSPSAVGRGHAPMSHGLLPTPGLQRPPKPSALTGGRGATTARRGKSPRPPSRPAQAA